MSDSNQESVIAKFSEGGSITINEETFNYPAPPPPDKILMRDESGQPWAITVRADGQLQTVKHPDGEPIAMARETSTEEFAAMLDKRFVALIKAGPGSD